MTRVISVFTAICATVLATTPAFSSSLENGKKEFMTYCAPCHGVSGKGDGPVAPELQKTPVDVTAYAGKNNGVFPGDKIRLMVDGRTMPRAHGTPQMPVWGQWFSYQATAGGLLQEDRKAINAEVKDRLDSLMIYIKSIQK